MGGYAEIKLYNPDGETYIIDLMDGKSVDGEIDHKLDDETGKWIDAQLRKIRDYINEALKEA